MAELHGYAFIWGGEDRPLADREHTVLRVTFAAGNSGAIQGERLRASSVSREALSHREPGAAKAFPSLGRDDTQLLPEHAAWEGAAWMGVLATETK